MADNVPITAGSGTNIASDDIGGVQHQRVKLSIGEDGSATDASRTNPVPMEAIGELIEAIEAQRMALQALVRTIGQSMPDTAGRLRVLVDSISSSLTLATITSWTRTMPAA